MSDATWTPAAVAGIAAGYALVSRRLAVTPVSGAMVFVGFGILLGPAAFDLVSLRQDSAQLRTLVEAALTLVLFTDAATVRPADLHSEGTLATRLLSIGLVLTIAAGWLLARPLFPGLTLWECALVGAILAPTDAALGKSAISDPRVPSLVRQTLNIERIDRDWRQILALAVAAGAYALAAVTHGSGFIAAWVAGFAFAGALRGRRPQTAQPAVEVADTTELAEDLGGLLAMLSLLFFGAVLLGPALQHLSWRIVGYSLLSLTVIRMVPVAFALARSRLKAPTVAYAGWFGPRGLASVVFGLLVAEERIPGVETISQVVAITVGLSVLLHGASAGLLAARYGRWYERAAADPHLRESADTPVTPPRRRLEPTGHPES